MRKQILIGFLGFSTLLLGWSGSVQAGPCDLRIRPVTPDTGFAQTVSRAFQQQGNLRGRRLQARSQAYGIFTVRNCALSSGRVQEVSVRYRASGILRGTQSVQSYSCGTTFKRQQARPNTWSNWQPLKTGCVKATSPRMNPFEDSLPESDYIPSGAPSPDEVSDGDERGDYGGPDEVDDGSGPGNPDDEFGDIYH